MASLNIRGKGGKVLSLSGQAYVNDVDGTKKLYVRTGTRPQQVETYGIATTKTATEYSPMAFDVDGKVGYIGRHETHYTYSTNQKVDMGVEEMVNTTPNPELTEIRVSTASQPYNYITNYRTTISVSDEFVIENTYPFTTNATRTNVSSKPYNKVIHRSTTFSNSATNSAVLVNTTPIALNATMTTTSTKPYNGVTSRSTTFEDKGTPETGYAANIPENFPNPDTSETKDNASGAYHTIYSIKKSQKVYTYKSTVYHTYNEETNVVLSSNATNPDYKCEATVGKYVYEGAFGNYNRVDYNGARVYLNDVYSCRYSWSFGYVDGKDYFVGSGIHYPNEGYNLGNQSGRDQLWKEKYNYGTYPQDVKYTVSANSYSQYAPYGNGGSGTVRYSYQSYYRTSYKMNFAYKDYNNLYATLSQTYTSWYYRSSAPVTSTKNEVRQTNKTHYDATSGEETWWTAPGSYEAGTKNDSCHGKENVLKTITATSSSYATTIHKSTQASYKDGTAIDETLVSAKSSYAEKINDNVSRTISFSKKVTYVSTTYPDSKEETQWDYVRESNQTSYSQQVNNTSSYTVYFSKQVSATSKGNYEEDYVVDTISKSNVSERYQVVNSTSSQSVRFSKKVSYTNSTSSQSYSTINNSTLEREPGTDLIPKVTHNFI